MAWRGTDGREMSIPEFADHVKKLKFDNWKPIGVTWHNTGAPTLVQWKKTAWSVRYKNLVSYYRDQQHWSAGPHLFIDDSAKPIKLFTPLNVRGTHSPSFNAQYIGIEHVGDYSREDDDAGPGLSVKKNGIAATAIICSKLGIDPLKMIKLHKEDPATDHDCPGKDMAQDKAKMVQAVLEYMGEGGDQPPNWGDLIDIKPAKREGVTTIDSLNMRAESSAASKVVGQLNINTPVTILNEAMNGETKWFLIENGNSTAWVAARYIKV